VIDLYARVHRAVGAAGGDLARTLYELDLASVDDVDLPASDDEWSMDGRSCYDFVTLLRTIVDGDRDKVRACMSAHCESHDAVIHERAVDGVASGW
jgi:hypothetical protein